MFFIAEKKHKTTSKTDHRNLLCCKTKGLHSLMIDEESIDEELRELSTELRALGSLGVILCLT